MKAPIPHHEVATAAPATDAKLMVTVGELVTRFLEACDVQAAFGVISIHNMPILDALHVRNKIRFISARGEAGACNMADAYGRIMRSTRTGSLGVCITSTGTGAGNAAGAMVEALTAGTPLLHLTGQIDSDYIDQDLGFIHEATNQLDMLRAVGKVAFRISNPQSALATLREAVRIAHTPPCGPVSIEIPIDVQGMMMPLPADLSPYLPAVSAVSSLSKDPSFQWLSDALQSAQHPLLWLGGGAREASAPVQRLVKLGWGVVTSVQGRGVIDEDHPACLGAFNLQKASAALYAQCDAMLVVGSRLRSNETMKYSLALPKNLYRIDANPLAQNRAYASEHFVCADATQALTALADDLEAKQKIDATWHTQISNAKAQAVAQVDAGLGAYVQLKDAVNRAVDQHFQGHCTWVRDITLSNTMWGNRSLVLRHPRSGVHALGGGIGQGLAMGVGAAVAAERMEFSNAKSATLPYKARKTIVLSGDGGFMLNVGELACAVQEQADMLIIVMNDGGYGVIKNIQDADYGGRHCYVDLHTPNFAQLCASMGCAHLHLQNPQDCDTLLAQALAHKIPMVLEVDMKAWGPFAVKFAGPPRKH
jgi:acetolactate synthase I/II/III large subunit